MLKLIYFQICLNQKNLNSTAQKRQIILLNNRFKPEIIELEGNNFQRMFQTELEDMRDDIPVRTVMTTKQRKESRFMSLLMAFEQGKIRTPWGNEASREFTRTLETQLNRFGMTKQGKLESVGVHDDLAMALALANWATKEFRGNIVMLDDDDMPGFDDWFKGGEAPSKGGTRPSEWFIA